MTSVGIFDHHTGDSWGALISAIEPLVTELDHFTFELSKTEISDAEIVKTLAQKDIAVCHFKRLSTAWGELLADSQKGKVRIRTSSIGMPNPAHAVTDKGAIALYLRPPHGKLKVQDWKKILEALADGKTGRGIANGQVPADLQRYFGEPAVFDVLPALSILCQGYLAAYAAPDGTAEPKFTDEGGHFASALREMGWSEALAELQDKSPLRATVETAEFWNVFDPNQTNVASLRKTIVDAGHTEWQRAGDCGADAEAQFEPVRTLIEKIGAPIGSPSVVAKAYLQLVKRFGGAV